MNETCVREPDRIREITDRIHDQWFSIEDVRYYPARAVLSVPYGSRRRMSTAGGEERFLEIGFVREYQLVETEGIGRYDFNELQFSESEGKLVITTGIPLLFEVAVEDFDIRICEGDAVQQEGTAS